MRGRGVDHQKQWTYDEILEKLRSLSNPKALEGMARFGICTKNAYGVSIPSLRKLAREIGVDHALARRLWSSGIHEGLILASMMGDPARVTEEQMEQWVTKFDSWDVCDQCCSNLFDKTPFSHKKALEWCSREEEFVKRAGFVLMAALAVHDKKAKDENFLKFLPIIRKESADQRNFVKKAVNWALRQIGKRNSQLNRAAIQTAKEIRGIDSRSARWIATDALRELTSGAVQKRLKQSKKR